MIFSIAMGADCSFEVKNIFKHNNSSVATVLCLIFVRFSLDILLHCARLGLLMGQKYFQQYAEISKFYISAH